MKKSIKSILSFQNWIVLVYFFMMQQAFAEDVSYKIKASYIYNILQFITFPQSEFEAHSQLNVCIVGENYFGSTLDSIEGASTPQARIHIMYLDDSSSTSLSSCNVIYLTRSEAGSTQSILDKINTKNVLTIAEYPSFIAHGGLIELYTREDRIRFRINHAKRTSFQIAAQLIQLGAGNL
jgi:hypothetical protein